MTDLRDRLDIADDVLRGWAIAAGDSGGILGNTGYVMASAGRTVVGAGSVPFRGLNLASDLVAQSYAVSPFLPDTADEASAQIADTVDSTAFVNDHPFLAAVGLGAAVANNAKQVTAGDRGAGSDMMNVAFGFLGPGIASKIRDGMRGDLASTVRNAANFDRNAYADLIDDLEDGFSRGGHMPVRIKLPGMDRQIRGIRTDHPPSPEATKATSSPIVQYMAADQYCTDCDEIAKKIKELSSNQGYILEARPIETGKLNVYEGGEIQSGMYYHQVYTDGGYVFDPRISDSSVPLGDWRKHMKGINPDGVEMSDKPRGMK